VFVRFWFLSERVCTKRDYNTNLQETNGRVVGGRTPTIVCAVSRPRTTIHTLKSYGRPRAISTRKCTRSGQKVPESYRKQTNYISPSTLFRLKRNVDGPFPGFHTFSRVFAVFTTTDDRTAKPGRFELGESSKPTNRYTRTRSKRSTSTVRETFRSVRAVRRRRKKH